jgi:hypothetical protein
MSPKEGLPNPESNNRQDKTDQPSDQQCFDKVKARRMLVGFLVARIGKRTQMRVGMRRKWTT